MTSSLSPLPEITVKFHSDSLNKVLLTSGDWLGKYPRLDLLYRGALYASLSVWTRTHTGLGSDI